MMTGSWPMLVKLAVLSGFGAVCYMLGKRSARRNTKYYSPLDKYLTYDSDYYYTNPTSYNTDIDYRYYVNYYMQSWYIDHRQFLTQYFSQILNTTLLTIEENIRQSIPVERDTPKSTPSTTIAETNPPPQNRISEIMKYGFPSLDNIRSFDNFVLSYDKRNRVANWVVEHLTKDTVKKNDQVDRTKCEFFEDTSIHPYFRATNADYKRSGFDRGHLAAAGNHKWNQKLCEQTFILSNMAPQVGEGFNRSMWNVLEKHVRKLARKYANVYVCTGPLYLPRVESDGKSYVKYQVIGPNTVAVPSHFFKVVLMEAADKSLEVEAYVMPNQRIQEGVPLAAFQVPLESIERASGLILFDKVKRTNIKRINSK